MLPGATGPDTELAAFTTPPGLMDGAGWAHAPERVASRHAKPAPQAFHADIRSVQNLTHGERNRSSVRHFDGEDGSVKRWVTVILSSATYLGFVSFAVM